MTSQGSEDGESKGVKMTQHYGDHRRFDSYKWEFKLGSSGVVKGKIGFNYESQNIKKSLVMSKLKILMVILNGLY